MNFETRQRVVQAIMGEHYYRACSEDCGRSDEMYRRLGELAEIDPPILAPEEVEECANHYREVYGG